MSKWIVYGCFGFTWIIEWMFLWQARTPAEWLAVSIALVVTPLVYLPMIEAMEEQ